MSVSVTQAVPFEVAIPQADLDDMLTRLRHTRWAHEFGNEDWAYGVNRAWLQDLVGYWTTQYDWRVHEARINAYPNYMAEIDGVPIHFLHVRGVGPSPKPLILSHGWPWTFWDWEKVIGPLTDPGAHGGDPADAFDVVVPSLPGAAFSMPLTTTGLGAPQIADLWHTLMTEVLGYGRFCAAGGDWGSTITGWLGHSYPDEVIGVWLTLPNVPGVALWEVTPEDFGPDEGWMRERNAAIRSTIVSHSTVHRTDPQTIAYALADSPTGTAAYILGRRRDWSDNDGDVYAVFDRDFLCTTASIYWLTGSIPSSMRIYKEHYTDNQPPAPRHDRSPAIEVPTAFAVFPKELLLLPRAVAARATNLQRWTVQPRGGHYPPAEQPELVIDEIQSFFSELS